MLKSLTAGFFLGIAITVAALFALPAVDQIRERSMITVMPNGGNAETFHINLPFDRIMTGAPGQREPMPAALEWPDDERLYGMRAELFKIRNNNDVVIGLASRIEAAENASGEIIEWVLHLPARGSVYLSMRPDAVDGQYRVGELRAGTREFQEMNGRVTERWIAAASAADDLHAGRIELVTVFKAAEDR